MEAWADYALTDLLMFAPDSYARLFVRANTEMWPLPLLTLAVAVWLGWAARRRPAAAWLVLALVWAGVAAWFLNLLYAQIQLAAPWFALAFAVQAVSLVLAGVCCQSGRGAPVPGFDRRSPWHPGRLLFVYAVALHPLAGIAAGRDWTGAEVFGIAPDPTALATLGLVLGGRGAGIWLLAAIPLAWCLVSGLTHLAMQQPHGLAVPVLAVLAIVVSWLYRRRAGQAEIRL